MNSGPLSDVVILDLSMFIAGPFGTSLLSDLGARVIKVEPIGGDPIRSNKTGPQMGGENAQFTSVNHGKESLAIDLKSQQGREVFYSLVRSSDVVYDNFRPGVRQRLGIRFADLQSINPAIITCSISGFGQHGEWSERPAYDLIIQALSGAMTITGSPDSGPTRIGYQIGDLAGGLYGAIAVLAALEQRRKTGAGSETEVSLLDAQIALLADEVTHHFLTRLDPQSWGSGHPFLVPYQSFDTADRPLVVAAVGREQFWLNLCKAIKRPDLVSDERFFDNECRVKNRSALVEILSFEFSQENIAHWLAVLNGHDVPCAPVLRVGDALDLPLLRQRNMIREVKTPDGSVMVAGNPIKFNEGGAEAVAKPAPGLGADGNAILQELTLFSEKQINKLFASGVVVSYSNAWEKKNNYRNHS